MMDGLKSLLKSTAALSLVLTGVSVGGLSLVDTAQAADKVSWNVSLWGKRRAFTEGVEAIAAYVKEKSGGNFEMTLNYGGALSKPRENLDGISLGAFEMAMFLRLLSSRQEPLGDRAGTADAADSPTARSRRRSIWRSTTTPMCRRNLANGTPSC